ncbi:MAG: hypothetical protein HYY25_00975 [Candidatus Wallbacteria bacterium]|nr:hypothetical protein [Candidatus Wallbacteria bacterium]
MMHVARQGFGIIFGVIVLFLVMMMTMGFAQFVFGNRVASDTQSGILGMLAVSIGQSAFEEAWRDIALSANTKGSALYTQLRKDVTDPRDALFETKLPLEETLREIEAAENWGGFQVVDKSVKMEVLGAGTLAGLTYETMGTIKLTATVKHKPTGVTRTLKATRGYKTGLLATPRPFDQATFFMMNPQLMIDSVGPEAANQRIKESLHWLEQLDQVLRRKMKERIEEVAANVNKGLGEAQAQGQGMDQSGVDPARFTRILDEAVVPPAPPYSEDVRSERHFFPKDQGDYVVFTLDAEVPDLERFYLPRRIEAKGNEIETARLRYNADSDATYKLLDEIDGLGKEAKDRKAEYEAKLEKAVKAVKQSMTELAARFDERLGIYKDFTDYFSERSKEGAAELQAFSGKFDVGGAQRPRAFYSFSGPDHAQAFRNLLDRYDKEAKALNAVVHVDTGGQVLALDNLRVRGKLVVVVTGQVRLANVTLTDPAQDLLTVHCDGRVAIDGRVAASVVASSDVGLGAGAVLTGNLVMYRSDAAQALRGKIVRDGRYKTSMGGTPEEQLQGQVVVALSPRTASLVVDRN